MTKDSVEKQFPWLFEGLGQLQGDYEISLKEGAKPHALSTPRRVAIPLVLCVKEELERMEQLRVIEQVEQLTEWCAELVVPKANGKVRLGVDLTKLSENVRRERHPIPAVEPTLAQLAGATLIFSQNLMPTWGFGKYPFQRSQLYLLLSSLPLADSVSSVSHLVLPQPQNIFREECPLFCLGSMGLGVSWTIY